jgi:hypothetical protein
MGKKRDLINKLKQENAKLEKDIKALIIGVDYRERLEIELRYKFRYEAADVGMFGNKEQIVMGNGIKDQMSTDKKSGIELIAEERQRQIEVKGWTEAHDAGHRKDELAILAMLYACPVKFRTILSPVNWLKTIGWDLRFWKPSDRITDLQKAGALIAAEIDRIQKLQTP